MLVWLLRSLKIAKNGRVNNNNITFFLICVKMEKYLLVEYLSTIKTAISETFKNTQRIKITCFDVSNQYIILGTSSGGIYVFKRSPCEFLKLIPSKEGTTVQIKISANEKNLALASSRGYVIIVENVFVDFNLRPLLYTEHEGNTITVMTWHGNDLYCGDNTGKISVSTISSTLTKAIFQTSSATLMHLDSTIIQIDIYKNYLLVSTKTCTYLCDTEKEQYKQIGKKLRDGNFGGCFSQRDASDYSSKCERTRSTFKTLGEEGNFSGAINNSDGKVYCARPGGRLWVANFEGTVLATYQFKQSFCENPSDLITIENTKEARLNVTKCDNNNVSKDFNFGKVYLLCANIIFTYDNQGIYFFDMETTSLICWSHVYDNIKDIQIVKRNIYVWRNNLQINIVSLQSLEELLTSAISSHQYLLCSDLCITFNNEVLTLIEKSNRINVLCLLPRKLKELGAKDLLEKTQNVLDKISEYYNDDENEMVLVENQYSPENKVQNSKVDKNLEKSEILYKQYVLNKSYKLAELTESSKILNSLKLNELPPLFESFVKYVQENYDEDPSLWCKEQMIKLSFRNSNNLNDLLPSTLDFLSASFLELNNYEVDCCNCKFPLPKAHKRKVEHYKLACKLYDYTENKKEYLNNIPSLYKHKASETKFNLSLIVQFSDLCLFKDCASKITFEKWDEIIKLFIRLNKGMCLNCDEKIDLEGILTWSDIGKHMVEIIGPKTAVKLLMRYSRFIPSGQLDMQFYQSCIFSTISDQQGPAVKFIGDMRIKETSHMCSENGRQVILGPARATNSRLFFLRSVTLVCKM
ncbi:BLOC-2 complex member HPS5 homolog isoform X2 [Diorhabda carinulata]|uniref:BLOC-2 complex member HPS5 homolog isoform X2 n=1 Tax=Diorhabda carinulata TaxID=1163345 RepID=UPI0025A17678|nr:BLOC-2 complex member HPS5 homolog isoform X2 [Diorhabda carinulata]